MKKIVCDADGVLVNWEYAFNLWYQDQGHVPLSGMDKMYDLSTKYGVSKPEMVKSVKAFNESVSIAYLPPMRDSIEYVARLADEGYRFDVVTSLSLEPKAQAYRTMNLEKLYGNVFDTIHFLDTGASKDECLHDNYEDSGLLWIEDKIENAEAGYAQGMKPILLAHGHNFEYSNDHIPIAKNWREIYDIVIGSDIISLMTAFPVGGRFIDPLRK